MAETEPANGARIQDRGDRFLDLREQALHARVKQEGLLVANQELVGLQVELGNQGREPKDIGCDFRRRRDHGLPRRDSISPVGGRVAVAPTLADLVATKSRARDGEGVQKGRAPDAQSVPQRRQEPGQALDVRDPIAAA